MKRKRVRAGLMITIAILAICLVHCKFEDEPKRNVPSLVATQMPPDNEVPDSGQQGGSGGIAGAGQGGEAGGMGGIVDTGGMGGFGGMAECIDDSDCPGETTDCKWPVCSDGQCGMQNAELYKPLLVQIYGDCAFLVCNGSGGILPQLIHDPISDDNECTYDGCNDEFVTVHPAKQKGIQCYLPTIPNKSGWCNGDGNNPQCVECIPNMKPCAVDWSCVNGFCVPPSP